MNPQKEIQRQRQRRKFRVRNRLRSNLQRPRLSVFRSVKHIYCQLIDDNQGRTLVSASSLDRQLRDQFPHGGGSCAAAVVVGKVVAERAIAAGIRQVRFDRGCYKFHGRVAALANAAREGGLEF